MRALPSARVVELLAELYRVVDTLLFETRGTADELVALGALARIRGAAGGEEPDIALVGSWATSCHGGTIHVTDGVVIVRAEPILALSSEQLDEIRQCVARDPGYAAGIVEWWIASDHLGVARLLSAGLQVERVAPLIVAAMRREEAGTMGKTPDYILGLDREGPKRGVRLSIGSEDDRFHVASPFLSGDDLRGLHHFAHGRGSIPPALAQWWQARTDLQRAVLADHLRQVREQTWDALIAEAENPLP